MGWKSKVLTWLLALMVPAVLIGIGVRLLLTPIYLELEYRMPGFPADDYGFSTQERLRWGGHGIAYLLNGEPPSYLGNLRFENGGPVFTDRELQHMQDVQRVVGRALDIWDLMVTAMLVLALVAWRAGRMPAYRKGLRLGGWLTLAIAGIAALLGTIGASGSGTLFWEFFSAFHGVFFSGDSWLFAYSDTLIRLYPLRFWQDSVLYIGVLAAAGAAGLAFGLKEAPALPKTMRM